jgi:hypothetical protein
VRHSTSSKCYGLRSIAPLECKALERGASESLTDCETMIATTSPVYESRTVATQSPKRVSQMKPLRKIAYVALAVRKHFFRSLAGGG